MPEWTPRTRLIDTYSLEWELRTAIARALVRWAAGWIDTSYRCDEDPTIRVPDVVREVVYEATHRANDLGLPLAKRIHYGAAVDQMVEEC